MRAARAGTNRAGVSHSLRASARRHRVERGDQSTFRQLGSALGIAPSTERTRCRRCGPRDAIHHGFSTRAGNGTEPAGHP
ncbi:hypothetical protein QE410_000055 [Microbacterium sp. SORGH_AS 1204]|nr:hypothetical protein [Microbacterium sp. SORGH_AS_1204]